MIRIAIIGVGNCASSLIQGIEYYKNVNKEDNGLARLNIGEYNIKDIHPVLGFDIDKRKVGKDLSKAIFEKPNCTKIFCKDILYLDAPVLMGNLLDGVPKHMLNYPEDISFRPLDKKPVDVIKELKKRKVDVLINYLPVGSEKATEFYAQCSIDARIAFINAMPIFIASDEKWIKKFEKAKLPVLGDDIKSQYGATFSHRQIIQGLIDRGIKIKSTTQENYGGNTDFLNMSDNIRIQSKLKSKKSSIETLIPYKIPDLYAGPGNKSDSKHGYKPELKDNKKAVIKVDGIGFGGIPVNIKLELSVEDSPNSAGIMVDAIRCAKIALDKGLCGNIPPSSYFFKHPYEKISDNKAKRLFDKFINKKNE